MPVNEDTTIVLPDIYVVPMLFCIFPYFSLFVGVAAVIRCMVVFASSALIFAMV